MKPAHALAVTRYRMLRDFTTVHIQFAPGEKRYTYKALKSERIKKGDRVVVMLWDGEMRIVQVVRVDRKPKFDVKANWDYKWIVQKIDTARHQQLEREDRRFLAHISAQETKRLLQESVKFFKFKGKTK